MIQSTPVKRNRAYRPRRSRPIVAQRSWNAPARVKMSGGRMSAPTRPGRRPPAAAPARRRVAAGARRAGSGSAPLVAAAAGAFVAGLVVGASGEDPRRDDGAAVRRRLGARRLRADARAAARRGPGRCARAGFAATYRDAARVATLARRRRRPRRASRRAAGSSCRCGCDTRIFGTLTAPLALPVVGDGRRSAEIAWSAEPRTAGAAPGREARRQHPHAAARGDPGPRRHAARRGRGAPVRAGRARVRDRRPRRPGAARACRRARSAAASRPARRSALTGLEREFDEQLAGTPGRQAARRRPGARRGRARRRAAPCARRSTPTSSAPRSRRSPGASAASPSCARATARCSRSPASPTPRPSRPAPCSRSSRSPPRSRPASPSRRASTRSRPPRCWRASSSRTPTASPAAARSRPRSRTRATRSSPRWAPSSAPRSSSPPPSSSASTPIRASRARCARRSPPPREIGDDLAVGSTAIGQGKVLATPLEFADDRRRDRRARRACAQPTLRKGDDPRRKRVDARGHGARTVNRYMRAVVTAGTGVAAQIPASSVAGKTGTAELRDTTNEDPDPVRPQRAARRRHDRHERLVRRLRAGRQAARRRRGHARRAGRRAARPPRRRRGSCSRPRSTAS